MCNLSSSSVKIVVPGYKIEYVYQEPLMIYHKLNFLQSLHG